MFATTPEAITFLIQTEYNCNMVVVLILTDFPAFWEAGPVEGGNNRPATRERQREIQTGSTRRTGSEGNGKLTVLPALPVTVPTAKEGALVGGGGWWRWRWRRWRWRRVAVAQPE